MGPPRVGQVFILTLIIFFATIIFSLWIIDEGIEPTLMDIAETKTRQVARWAINEAVNKKTAEEMEENESALNFESDEAGNVVSGDWNEELINEVHRNTTFRVQNFLKKVENGEILPESSLDIESNAENNGVASDNVDQLPTIAEIPLGQATRNTLLANLGPKIPVHFSILGDVQGDLVDVVEPYGINAALFNLYVELKVTVRIVVPFSTDTAVVKQRVLVDRKVIHGEVPNFYGGQGGSMPDVTIPDESLQ
ncbi:sporulation protein YunB [Salinibacillus xinjiangensis]|uniref:Sporulation protein YunB n=2 Tax=Salinibacillus xinjiangensis TaxID=1229268 RepID=A0A6G1X2P4_9BACI|nr:sporulation protein YunB [Salinibacillus xinjiangensis]